ncbi:putative virion structural protein 13 [Salmonella phage SPAsTU]|nr:putative virion structural protein 13 [Salmonella phage SPAsTU]
MALKLSWKNTNVVANSVVIYRGDAPLDSSALPEPLVELTGGETSWIDEDAAFGNTYYYVFGVKTANDLVLTPNQQVLVADNRGVGPSTLMYGDDNIGYYGTVLTADFVTNLDVVAAGKSTNGLPSSLATFVWHKFVRNGKILYMPSTTLGDVSYTNLYHAGFVHGIDAEFPEGILSTTGLTPTNQLTTFEFKGSTYKIRLMRGYNDGSFADIGDWNTATVDHDTLAVAQDNEYNDLFYSLLRWVPLKQRTENFAELNFQQWLLSSGATSNSSSAGVEAARGRIAVQERVANGNCLTRGQRNYIYSYNSSTTADTKGHPQKLTIQGVTANSQWVPILELVETTADVTL